MDIFDMDMYGCEKKVAPYIDILYDAIFQSRNQFKSLIEKKSFGFSYEETKPKQLKGIKEKTEGRSTYATSKKILSVSQS